MCWGRRQVSSLSKGFTSQPPDERPEQTRRVLFQIAPHLRPFLLPLLGCTALITTAATTTLVDGLAIKWLLDVALPRHSSTAVILCGALLFHQHELALRARQPWCNRPFLHGETEPCINGRILAVGAYFKAPNDALANQLLGQQLEDGGWNCEAVEPSAKRPKSQRSSFHTTICVLEGLLAYEQAGRKRTAVTRARERAENYLLERRMFRSLRTGEVIDERWLRFSFPTFWHYDVLRGLDYLRNAGIKTR
jgi:hypothetical protein